MVKKGVSMLLALVMAMTMLAGCGNSEKSSVKSETKLSGTESESSEDSQNTGDDLEDEEIDPDEIVTIEYYGVDLTGNNDITDIAAAVNEITEKKIGVHVNFNMLDFGSYLQQVSLKMSGNERIDLMNYVPAPPATFSSMMSQNQLMDMTELLEEYAPETLAAIGEYIKGTTVNDKIYGVSTMCGFATNTYVIMRKDILEALDLLEKAENMSSWTEYEEILAAVYEANQSGELSGELQTQACVTNANVSGGIYPLGSIFMGEDAWKDNYGVDVLGDNYGIIAADQESSTVSAYYRSEDYLNTLKRVNDWYQKGYVYKDAAFTEESGDTLMANGVSFSFIVNGQVGIENTRRTTTGHEVVAAKVLSVPMGTSVSQTWGLAVPITAKEPEAAVKFLNLLYEDAEIMNLLTWGIEGRDYVLNEAGEAEKQENCTYSGNMFLWGNGLLTYPAKGQGSDYMQQLAKADEDAQISRFLGFSMDTSALSNELTAVNNVINEYRANLESGAVANLESEYAKYCKAMEDAGVQLILDAYQEQLTAWLDRQ